jgi:hypothetical protein
VISPGPSECSAVSRRRQLFPQARSVCKLPIFNKLQRGGVHAVTQVGGLGAIVKYVSQVRLAFDTGNRIPAHPLADISRLPDILLRDRSPKTRPARSRFKLRIRTE